MASLEPIAERALWVLLAERTALRGLAGLPPSVQRLSLRGATLPSLEELDGHGLRHLDVSRVDAPWPVALVFPSLETLDVSATTLATFAGLRAGGPLRELRATPMAGRLNPSALLAFAPLRRLALPVSALRGEHGRALRLRHHVVPTTPT